jgi:hypothetical protein
VIQDRWRLLRYAALWTGVGLLLAAALSVPVLLSQVRQTQLEGTPTGKKLVASADRILDCTDAGGDGHRPGKCFQQSQKRTAEVLASVQRIILLSAVCAVDLDPDATVEQRVQQITACVTRRLAKQP